MKDWTKLNKKYSGKWVAFDKDEETVITSGDTAEQVYSDAAEKGKKYAILTRIPKNSTYFSG